MWAFCNSTGNNCGESCPSALVAYQKRVFSTASFAIHTNLSMSASGLGWFSGWHFCSWTLQHHCDAAAVPARQTLVSQLRRQFAEGRVAKGWKSQTKLHTNVHKHTRIYCANRPDPVPTLFSDRKPEQRVFFLFCFFPFPYQVERAVCLML